MSCNVACLEVLGEEKSVKISLIFFMWGFVFTFLNQSWEPFPVAFLTHRYDVNIVFALILILFSLGKL